MLLLSTARGRRRTLQDRLEFVIKPSRTPKETCDPPGHRPAMVGSFYSRGAEGGMAEARGIVEVVGEDGLSSAEAAAGRASGGITTTSSRLPNFFVIGALRSGTTSLYEYLAAHPDVFMSTVKEPGFFIHTSVALAHPLGGTERADHDADAARVEELAKDLQWVPLALPGRRPGRYSSARPRPSIWATPIAPWHLRGYVPDTKLVALLRNPTERAFPTWCTPIASTPSTGRWAASAPTDRWTRRSPTPSVGPERLLSPAPDELPVLLPG